MAHIETYRYGQGKIFLAKRNADGTPGVERWVGDVSGASISFTVESFAHKESYSGTKQEVRNIITGRSGEVSLTFHEFSAENLRTVLLGTTATITGQSVTGFKLPEEIAAGDLVSLPHPNVSDVSISTLSEGVDFTVDKIFGKIEFLKPQSAFQQTASYTFKDYESVAMMTKNAEDLFLRYEGENLAEENEHELVELYKVNFNPAETLELINTEDSLAGLTATAKVLADTTKSNSGDLGRFGRVVKIKG